MTKLLLIVLRKIYLSDIVINITRATLRAPPRSITKKNLRSKWQGAKIMKTSFSEEIEQAMLHKIYEFKMFPY